MPNKRSRGNSAKQTNRNIGILIVGALTVAVVLVAVGLNARSHPVVAGTYVPPLMETSTPYPEVASIELHRGARVLIFGDSYTAGYGATKPTDGYAYKMAKLTGWDVSVEVIGSTGYLAPGNKNQGTFAQRIAALDYPDDFQMIILQGGSNDQKVQGQDFDGAIANTVTILRNKFPSASIVMLGPVAVSTSTNADKQRINTSLERYARKNGIPFISPVEQVWFKTSDQATLINVKVGHPNSDGYIVMAQKLTDAIADFVTTTD